MKQWGNIFNIVINIKYIILKLVNKKKLVSYAFQKQSNNKSTGVLNA